MRRIGKGFLWMCVLSVVFTGCGILAGKEEKAPSGIESEKKQQENTDGEEKGDVGETADYHSGNIDMKMKILPDWEYTVKAGDEIKDDSEPEDVKARISVANKENADITFALEYWKRFGMCGTGVTFEKLTLSSGATATKATEIMDEILYLTVVMDKEEAEAGSYVVMCQINKEEWKQYEKDIIEMIKSIEVSY